MLTLRLRMEFRPERFDQAAAVLRALLGPVRAEEGCRATRLLRDADGACALTWVEEWRTEDDFERRLRSPTFRRLLAVIELAATTPVVEIDSVAWRRSFDLVEELLEHSGQRRSERMEI